MTAASMRMQGPPLRRGGRLGLLALPCLLCACLAGSPAVSLYTLEAMSPPVVQDAEGGAQVISLGPITLPGYPDRTQIVTRTDAHELSASERHRWAEPLDEAVSRVLLREVSSRLPGRRVLPFGVGPRGDLRLEVAFHELDRRPDGSVRLVAHWVLERSELGGSTVEGWTEVDEEALGATHGESAAAMSRALARLADELVVALSRS